MFEPDVTTSEVVLMYVGIFVFLFGLTLGQLLKYMKCNLQYKFLYL